MNPIDGAVFIFLSIINNKTAKSKTCEDSVYKEEEDGEEETAGKPADAETEADKEAGASEPEPESAALVQERATKKKMFNFFVSASSFIQDFSSGARTPHCFHVSRAAFTTLCLSAWCRMYT